MSVEEDMRALHECINVLLARQSESLAAVGVAVEAVRVRLARTLASTGRQLAMRDASRVALLRDAVIEVIDLLDALTSELRERRCPICGRTDTHTHGDEVH